MSTPRYVVKRVGNDFQVKRSDSMHRFNSAAFSAGGGALTLLGLRRGGLSGGVVAAVGGLLLYRGITGENPLACLTAHQSAIFEEGAPGPSHQHEHKIGQAQQTPQDPTEEAAMESFPASDAPAHSARK
jgi:hypothetical protein